MDTSALRTDAGHPRLKDLLHASPEVEAIEIFVTDVNGIGRGKWIPRSKADELQGPGLPMPRSVFALDIWGRDVAEAGLAFGTGDPDGLCRPVGPAAIIPWLKRPTAQVMVELADADGAPFFADPRRVLSKVVEHYAARGLKPVVAAELEFYLIEPKTSTPTPPGGGSIDHSQVLSVDALQRLEPLLVEIAEACAAQGVPATAMSRENGPGQYEINLHHADDAVLAADHAILLKRIVKGLARRHGLAATFMAKPYGLQAGSGLHIHASLLDSQGRPAFADAAGAPSEVLLHAVGGLLASMPDAMALFAPHANSYRRLQPFSHAPTQASWGFDNRASAVRVITGKPMAIRLEHRVAGADANPYLAIAAVLAGALAGIEAKTSPGDPTLGENSPTARLPSDWAGAIERFERSSFIREALGADYQRLFSACKRQDLASFAQRVPDTEHDACLETV